MTVMSSTENVHMSVQRTQGKHIPIRDKRRKNTTTHEKNMTILIGLHVYMYWDLGGKNKHSCICVI